MAPPPKPSLSDLTKKLPGAVTKTTTDRVKSLGKTVARAARPTTYIKQGASMLASAALAELPELGLIGAPISSFIQDVRNNLISKRNKQLPGAATPAAGANQQGQTKTNPGQPNAANNNNASLKPVIRLLTSIDKNVKNILALLGKVYIENKTLTSITAKVWDVSKKSLAATRAGNTQAYNLMKNKMFKDQELAGERVLPTEKEGLPQQKSEKGLDTKLGEGLVEKIIEGDIGAHIIETIGGTLVGMLTGGVKGLLRVAGKGLIKSLSLGARGLASVGEKLMEGVEGSSVLKGAGRLAANAGAAAAIGNTAVDIYKGTNFTQWAKDTKEGFDKGGLKGGLKSFFTDDQVENLGKAWYQGSKETISAIITPFKFITESIADKLGIKEGLEKQEKFIGDTVSGAGNDLSRLTAWVMSDKFSRQQQSLLNPDDDVKLSDMAGNKPRISDNATTQQLNSVQLSKYQQMQSAKQEQTRLQMQKDMMDAELQSRNSQGSGGLTAVDNSRNNIANTAITTAPARSGNELSNVIYGNTPGTN